MLLNCRPPLFAGYCGSHYKRSFRPSSAFGSAIEPRATNPVVGWVLKNTHVMPINQEAASTASLRQTISKLQHGFLVGIFPEGTRTLTGELGEVKPGFAAIIRRAKRPIYPVGIAGAYQALPYGGWFLKPTRVRVVFGDPITVEELESFSNRDQDGALCALVQTRIAACCDAAELWRKTGTAPSET